MGGPMSVHDQAQFPWIQPEQALIRLALHGLRQVFAPSRWLHGSERIIAFAVWIGFALHLTGLLPGLLDAMDAIGFHVGKQRISLLIVLMLIGEVVTSIITQGSGAMLSLIGAATRLLVLAGLMWAGGDITLLLIDAGHDLRVARILLGRINAELHREREEQP